jgi:ribosomal protein S18 acetylase RimI-like enzyme
MSPQGRFGKYGDMKRLHRLRASGIRTLPPKDARVRDRSASPGSWRVSIRRANLSDIGSIGRLSTTVFSVYGPYGHLIPGWFESNLAITLVATEKGAPVGFAMMGRLFPEAPEKESRCELLALAVEPRLHRRGIGGMLLRSIEKEAKRLGESVLFLHTGVDNLPAQNLFKKNHFIPLSFKKHFYPAGQDAVMMIKDI